MIVEEFFKKYKEITCNIINKVKADEEIDALIEERQNIIDEIGKLNVNSEEKKAVYEKMNLSKYDEELDTSIKEKMGDIKKEINICNKRRNAITNYSSSTRQGNLFARKV